MARRRTILTSTAAAVFLAAGITSCTTQAEPPPQGNPAPVISTPPPSAYTDYPAPSDTPIVKMGETHTYDDGLQVTITEWGTDPAGEYPGYTQTVPPGSPVPVYQISITNGTSEPFDPAAVMIDVTNTATGEYVSALHTDNSSPLFWSGMILPGNTAVNRSGYDVDPAAPTTITVAVDLNRMPLLVDNSQ